MSPRKLFRKLKDLLRPREQDKGRFQTSASMSCTQVPQSCNPNASAHSIQPSSPGLGYATGAPPIVTTRQGSVAANPKAGVLCPPMQSSLIANHHVFPSVKSLQSVSTLGYGGGSCHLASRSSSPYLQQNSSQDIPAVPDFHSIPRAAAPEGTFANAHDFIIWNASLNDGITREEWGVAEKERRVWEEEARAESKRRAEEERRMGEEKQAKEALEKLAAKGMPGAMLNSSERAYAPRCDEGTRQTWRTRIVGWAREGEARGLLWLSGPAGVGKSAIAQTIAEELKREGLLGAVFFFSRPNSCSDPNVVIPTLIYQLALLLPEYQRIVSQRLAKDPLILNADRHLLFRELIIDPIRSLATQLWTTVQQPLLIVLDGLDECNGREAQCEFVEMISRYTFREGSSLRLRWLICSRPEPDLKVAFSSAECKAVCIEEKIEVEDGEAQEDAMRILNKGFTKIRKRYPDQVTEDWPAEDQVRFIADRASGHLGFASFIIRFIGDKEYGDPSGQLDVCLRFLKRTSNLTDLNPLYALDLLYTQILSDIPKKILPTTLRILGLFIFYHNKHLTVAAHANFLGLNQASFYRSLQRLHSVISVPPASDAAKKPIHIYHASFSEYLKDPARSGRFVLREGVVPYLDIALSGLKWLDYGRKLRSEKVIPELAWIPPHTPRAAVLQSLCRFSFTPCWKACPQVPEDSLVTLIKVLKNFDFHLNYTSWRPEETHDFAYFIRWLISLGARQKALVVINGWSTDDDYALKDATICHRVDDPCAFVTPFLEGVAHSEFYCISLRLGRLNPIPFKLLVSSVFDPIFAIPE